MAKPQVRRSSARSGSAAARRVEERGSRFQGWRTTDEEEVERRRLRAEAEGLAVRSLEPAYRPFATYAVTSAADGRDEGRKYRVELRTLAERLNTCSCPDHRVNGLGTCKHVEAVLRHLSGRGGIADPRRRRCRRSHAARGRRGDVHRALPGDRERVLTRRRASQARRESP